jgi:hypothetical protein
MLLFIVTVHRIWIDISSCLQQRKQLSTSLDMSHVFYITIIYYIIASIYMKNCNVCKVVSKSMKDFKDWKIDP